MVNLIDTIKRNKLIQKKDKVLVAVSGGPDSMALLLKLNRLKSSFGLSLHIAHLDHSLRKDSKSDAIFVKNWAKKLNIPITIKKLGHKFKHNKGSLEEIFRNQRLKFLITTAKKIKADKVALGHNLDDQAETVLMRILRGTGLSGLSGISLKREIHGKTFIRPLLETSRIEIDKFLKKGGIKPCIDSTNKKDIFLRNKIRHNLIPLLKKEYNKNIVAGLANLAETVSYDYAYLDKAVKQSLGKSGLNLKINKLKKLHPAILRLKIRQSIAKLQGDTRRINFQHIKEIVDLLNFRPTKAVVDLPKGISVKKTRNFLTFYKR